MSNGNATAEGMPEARVEHLRTLVTLDRDLIEPEYLVAQSVIVIDQLMRAAEEIGVALNWETLSTSIHIVEPSYASLRAVADVL